MPNEDFQPAARRPGRPSDEPFRTLREQPSVSPVDGRVIGWYPVALPEEITALRRRLEVEAGGWSVTPVAARVRRLGALREVLYARSEEVVSLLAREIGRPLVEGYAAEILPTLRSLSWLERHAPAVLAPRPLRGGSRRLRQEWAPFGTVGVLSPWNYPVFLGLSSVAAALAAGNTVLWKPSDLALATASLLWEIVEEAELGHLVAVAPGDEAIGAAVVAAGCDKYLFIGGVTGGRRVLEELGSRGIPAVAELSGSDPMIVCSDADLSLAAASAVWARVTGAGQACMAPRRIFVPWPRYEEFLREVRDRLISVRMGNPSDAATELGPLRTEELRGAAQSLIHDALEQGARLLYGGLPGAGEGFYFQPTLLADCTESMRVMREDIFAPILVVSPVGSVEEAVRRANASSFGLTASVWTRDRRAGTAIARRLPGGLVSVNDTLLPGAEPAVPFGGQGASGYGRMRGEAGLLEMVQGRVLDSGPSPHAPRRHLFPFRNGTLEILRGMAAWEGARGRDRWAAVRRLVQGMRGYDR